MLLCAVRVHDADSPIDHATMERMMLVLKHKTKGRNGLKIMSEEEVVMLISARQCLILVVLYPSYC